MSCPRPFLAFAALSAVSACGVDITASGTAVGNPTDMSGHVAPGASLGWESATARVSTVAFTDCAGAQEVRTIDADVDLLGGTSLEVPAGSWCRFGLAFASPLALSGATEGGDSFAFALVVDAVSVAAPRGISTDAGPFVFELGSPGWVSADDVAAGQPDSIRQSELVAALKSTSSLYRDPDGDGAVGDDERDEGREAGSDDDDDDDS